MEKTLTFKEFQVLVLKFLENGNKITIQQNSESSVPEFSINLPVTKCVPIYDGIQFHVGGGYINFSFNKEQIFNDDGLFNDNFSFEENTFTLEFEYDSDKPKGYWLFIGKANLFFHGNQIEEILDNIQEETKKQFELENKHQQLIRESNRSIDKEIWDSIDNMLEK